MSGYGNTVDIQIWLVGKLIDATSPNPQGSNKVTIPEFQRRLVWNKAKQSLLIDSIRKGYPFGSILLFEDIKKGQELRDGKTYYNLIDGLQRTQALRSYINNQNGFFSKAELGDELIELIAQKLNRKTEAGKDRIAQEIVKWVQHNKGFDARTGWRTDGLIRHLIFEILNYSHESILFKDLYLQLTMDEELTYYLGSFLDSVSNESRAILDAEVPVIVFTGPSSELPRVFELLNSKGTALSRYEIFAAQWIDNRQRIANPEIIEAIWKKYEALEEEGFTLDVAEEAPDKETRRQREYTLFDYLFGLGQFLSDKFPRLFKLAKDDQPSSVGFNLMTACVGLHVSQMADLPQKIRGLDLTTLEGCILDSTRFVDNVLKPILSAKQYGRKAAPIYHSELMIVSLIATAFQVRFGLADLSDNPNWRADRRKLKKNLAMFYLHDILHDDWRGSGDSKLYETVKSLRYLVASPPNEKRWNEILDDWHYRNQLELLHGKDTKRHIRDSRSEYLLLKYIYSQKYSDMKVYEVEHIIPVKELQALMSSGEEWHLNVIGNLALIAKDKSSQQSDQLCPANLFPMELNQNSYEDFVMNRWERLKAEFIGAWRDHIPPSD